MDKGSRERKNDLTEMLARVLAVQLYVVGASQGSIARAVGKSKTWVNTLLRGIPKVRRS